MVFYRYLGYGITDSNGEAKLEYDENGNHLDHSITGTGAGELDIVASLDKPIGSGSIVSETYAIYDCILKDIGTQADHNDSMWTLARGTLNRGDDSTEIVMNTGETNVMVYFNLTNKDSFMIEFDAIFDCVRGSSSGELQFRSSSWSILGGVYLADYPKDTWTHIKLQVKNGQLTIWIGNTQLTPTSISNAGMFNFYIGSEDNYFKYKNFRYYPV